MAMTSKHRLTSRDDIELRVVVKFRVGLKPSRAVEEILKPPGSLLATDRSKAVVLV